MLQSLHPALTLVPGSRAVHQETSNGRRHRWLSILRTWMARSRQRQALGELDDHLLDDIGLTRAQAAREIAKPFWCS